MKFGADFCAEDAVRLSPYKDDNPKYAKITPFKASSDLLYSPILMYMKTKSEV